MTMSRSIRTLTAGLLAGGVLTTGLLLGMPAATAAPYNGQTQVTISTTDPQAGASITITISHLVPGTKVLIFLHSEKVLIGSATADAAGNVVASATVPKTACGAHYITVETTDGDVLQTFNVTIQGTPGTTCDNGTSVASATSATDTSLASTGAAVTGLSVVGIALVGGGVFLVQASRRRKVAVTDGPDGEPTDTD